MPCELRVQLTVVRGALSFDPPLEELRAQYYRTHLRAFLNIPALFKVWVCDLMFFMGPIRCVVRHAFT